MHFTTAEIGSFVGSFIWPLLRVTAFVTALPVYSTRGIPVQVRLVFAVSLTVLVWFLAPPTPTLDPLSGDGLICVAQQLAIGLGIGFTLRLVFAALVTAGQLVALGMGLGFASMVDPTNGVQVPVLSMFYTIMGTLLFFAIGGHLAAIQVLVESFRVLPIAPEGLPIQGYWQVVEAAAWVFSGGVLIALPAVTTVLVVNVSFGVVARAAPQLNIFAVGFPVIITAGFMAMAVTVPTVLPHFETLTDEALALMRDMMQR